MPWTGNNCVAEGVKESEGVTVLQKTFSMESARDSPRYRTFVGNGARCRAVAVYSISPSAQRNQGDGGEVSEMLMIVEFESAAEDGFRIASTDARTGYLTRELAHLK